MLTSPIHDFEKKNTIFHVFKVIRSKSVIFDPEDGDMTIPRKSDTHQTTQRYTL